MDIKKLRTRLGLSQDKFAAELGVAPYTVRRWEAHKTTPSPMAQRAIEEVFREALEKLNNTTK